MQVNLITTDWDDYTVTTPGVFIEAENAVAIEVKGDVKKLKGFRLDKPFKKAELASGFVYMIMVPVTSAK